MCAFRAASSNSEANARQLDPSTHASPLSLSNLSAAQIFATLYGGFVAYFLQKPLGPFGLPNHFILPNIGPYAIYLLGRDIKPDDVGGLSQELETPSIFCRQI
jgi:hypothetical protein